MHCTAVWLYVILWYHWNVRLFQFLFLSILVCRLLQCCSILPCSAASNCSFLCKNWRNCGPIFVPCVPSLVVQRGTITQLSWPGYNSIYLNTTNKPGAGIPSLDIRIVLSQQFLLNIKHLQPQHLLLQVAMCVTWSDDLCVLSPFDRVVRLGGGDLRVIFIIQLSPILH